MGHPHLEVDVPGLARVGGDVTASAPGFAKAYAAQSEALSTGSGLPGWSTGAALAGAVQAWAAFVRNLAGQVGTLGAELTTASREYQGADAHAAAGLRNAGAGSPDRAGGVHSGPAPR